MHQDRPEDTHLWTSGTAATTRYGELENALAFISDRLIDADFEIQLNVEPLHDNGRGRWTVDGDGRQTRCCPN